MQSGGKKTAPATKGPLFEVVDGVVRLQERGDIDAAGAHRTARKVRELLATTGKPLRLLIDMDQCGRPTTEAREIQFALVKETPGLRVAVVGTHPVARALATFALVITRQDDMKLFRTEREALQWLNAGLPPHRRDEQDG